ncbi:sodium-dependent bicarbonate transport family permease [Thiomicrorhabdus indica]|uniref:sodium-dependent bicarbonate transport family permease n=1 Tax=Thiomicrorhabdus indica TaxID=2267253 RepID=UPI00102D8F3F|nr:sodium-dependent bicarbonate transport family permease [Thiomicrorhabdus indica]
MGLDSLLIPAVLFFALGVFAKLINSDLKFPEGMTKGIGIYLLLAIGLKGGIALNGADLGLALSSILWGVILGFGLPLIGYFILRFRNKISKFDAAAIAAHYGSVSAATFLTAVAFLEVSGVTYETYPIIMMVIMESPAIIFGLVIAAMVRKQMAAENVQGGQAEQVKTEWGPLLKEAFTNGSVVVLLGAMVIGAIASPEALDKVKPFTQEIFMGVLCLFLLDMGMEAAKKADTLKQAGVTLVSFGIIMPLVGGTIGMMVGISILGFSVGGAFLLAILSASASYIAVPPVMRYGVPEANSSYYLTLSLGITFPFNVVVGIPLFYQMTTMYAAL